MPLDEMRLMLEQWGNITGEPRGVYYTEVLGSNHRDRACVAAERRQRVEQDRPCREARQR
jgi:hypothetical protein